MLDFQMLIEKGTQSAAAPLIHYLEGFGPTDPENVWRVEMVISEYFFACRNEEAALFWARSAFKVAPEQIRKEIAEAIFYLRKFSDCKFLRSSLKRK